MLACVPPVQQAAGTGQALYVANAANDTIAVLDSQNGRALGPVVRTTRGPGQIVAGPRGMLLHLSVTGDGSAHVTLLRRTPSEVNGWTAQSLNMGGRVSQAMLAANGLGTAVIAYHVVQSGTAPCRLAMVEQLGQTVERVHTVCRQREWISSVALGGSTTSPVAYIGLWRSEGDDGNVAVSAPRVVAIDVQSGAMLASRRLSSPATRLIVTSSPDGLGEQLYAVEPQEYTDVDFLAAGRARLLALNPVTLDIDRELPLPYAPAHVAISPDGISAYGVSSEGRSLWHTDLYSGATSRLADLPARGADIVATDTWIFVAIPSHGHVLIIDRRRGRLVSNIPTGRQPIALTLGPHP